MNGRSSTSGAFKGNNSCRDEVESLVVDMTFRSNGDEESESRNAQTVSHVLRPTQVRIGENAHKGRASGVDLLDKGLDDSRQVFTRSEKSPSVLHRERQFYRRQTVRNGDTSDKAVRMAKRVMRREDTVEVVLIAFGDEEGKGDGSGGGSQNFAEAEQRSNVTIQREGDCEYVRGA